MEWPSAVTSSWETHAVGQHAGLVPVEGVLHREESQQLRLRRRRDLIPLCRRWRRHHMSSTNSAGSGRGRVRLQRRRSRGPYRWLHIACCTQWQCYRSHMPVVVCTEAGKQGHKQDTCLWMLRRAAGLVAPAVAAPQRPAVSAAVEAVSVAAAAPAAVPADPLCAAAPPAVGTTAPPAAVESMSADGIFDMVGCLTAVEAVRVVTLAAHSPICSPAWSAATWLASAPRQLPEVPRRTLSPAYAAC